MAKNPFISAHDSLVGLFEETSRKVHFDLIVNKDCLVDSCFICVDDSVPSIVVVGVK